MVEKNIQFRDLYSAHIILNEKYTRQYNRLFPGTQVVVKIHLNYCQVIEVSNYNVMTALPSKVAKLVFPL